MKKRSLLLTSIAILIVSHFAHSQWQWQNPVPQGNDIKKLFFTDANNGWIVGNAGLSSYTVDGGENWNTIGIECYNDLNAICFADAMHGWIFGNDTILRTTNGGADWEPVGAVLNNPPFSGLFKENVIDASFVDSSKGWLITGDKIFFTQDAGNSWAEQFCLPCHHYSKSICFVDDTTGYVTAWKEYATSGGAHTLIKTTDGGESWTISNLFNTVVNNSKSCVYFINPLEGWVVGEIGRIWHTTNGGEDWTFQYGVTGNKDFYSVYFIDEDHGWIAGEGCILYTDNGGDDWTVALSQDDLILNSVYFADEWNGWAAGNQGELFYSQDGGINWFQIKTGISNSGLFAVHFSDNYNGWAVGDSGTILHTDNGGEDWETQESGINDDITSVFFINNNRGWATCNNNIIVHTIDGGSTWEIQEFEEGYELNAIFFIDEDNGWIVGSSGSGIILHTNDGGINWNIQWTMNPGGSYTVLKDITFVDSYHGWASGGYAFYSATIGIILYTNDGGQTWIEQTGGDNWGMVKSVYFTDVQSGWAIVDGGGHSSNSYVINTNDGGKNWNIIENIGGEINSIFFADELNGWIIGGGVYINGIYSKIFVTSDGGTTWSPQYCPADFDMKSIYFSDPDNGWMVGNNGTILYLDNTGPVGMEEFIAQSPDFEVGVFPNPCSSATNIQFTIHKSRFTIIDVFGIDGKKIERLLEEVKMPGKYKIEIDVSDLPAGMYYFRIQAGEMVGGGKMVKISDS